MVYAAILAGGRGTRMGSDIPKQYLKIDNVPIIIHTLRRFVHCDDVDETVVCVPRGYLDYTLEIINKYPDVANNVEVIEGGADRTGSLINACDFFRSRGEVSEQDVIITHDCVRPFVTDEIIKSSISQAGIYGGATAAVPAVDTICVSRGGSVIDSVPNRAELYSVQTPQTFMMKEFCNLLDSITDDERARVTDASAVLIMKGRTVALSLGSPSNIKITHPDDIAFAENILKKLQFIKY